MVGSSIIRNLKRNKFVNISTVSKSKLNLLNQKDTLKFLKKKKFDIVIIAAAKVGGINANNKFRADFLYENTQIQNNLIYGSFLTKVKKLIFLGSSCIYPRNSKQPIKENMLLTGSLEQTNEPYAIAKISGVKLCESLNQQYGTNFISLMPCNLYGPNDNYDLNNSHFLPALIRKAYEAKIKKKKSIILWGNGKPKRELMHVDDLAEACVFFLKKKIKESLINIGSGEELKISEYAKKVCDLVGFKGSILFDEKMPSGTHRKILDCSIAKSYGWSSKIKFQDGLESAYFDFIKNYKEINK